jgi:hypothetical protein
LPNCHIKCEMRKYERGKLGGNARSGERAIDMFTFGLARAWDGRFRISAGLRPIPKGGGIPGTVGSRYCPLRSVMLQLRLLRLRRRCCWTPESFYRSSAGVLGYQLEAGRDENQPVE